MPTQHTILVRTPLVSLPAWQQALDAGNWPLRLVDFEGSLLADAVVRAELERMPVRFTLAHLTHAQLDAQWHAAPVPKAWPYGIRIAEYRPGSFEMRTRSGIAATVAACAYGVAAAGIWYWPNAASQNVQEMSVMLDTVRRDFPIWMEVFVDRKHAPNP